MIVKRYTPEDATNWNAFVRTSRNGTFLFEREYMDYHCDRFEDYSLMIFDNEGALSAVLPAHVVGDSIASHNGLSFGGLLVSSKMRVADYLTSFESLLLHLQQLNFTTFDYKAVPHIYHRQPTEEDRYVFFLLNAALVRRDLLTVLDRKNALPYQSRRIRGIKKAQAAGVTLQEEQNFSVYWDLLAETLASRHGAEPVHSLAEIQLLCARFPTNIRLHCAHSTDGELLAGVVLYISERVAHAQYIASSPRGRDLGVSRSALRFADPRPCFVCQVF